MEEAKAGTRDSTCPGKRQYLLVAIAPGGKDRTAGSEAERELRPGCVGRLGHLILWILS